VNTYKDNAWHLALSIVKNTEDAKDVLQQSFLSALENLGRFRNEAKFSTWLYKIVYHESIRWVKKNSIFSDAPVSEELPYNGPDQTDADNFRRKF
jgi:RNA polymerase sigma-70 factor (ECF subfamily)